MKNSLVLLSLVVAAMDLLISKELDFILVCVLLVVWRNWFIGAFDAFLINLPFLVLIIIGVMLGTHNGIRDLVRDLFIYSKNIIFFLGGLLLSKYVKNFNSFFKYFTIFALISSLVHLWNFAVNIKSAGSLEAIRQAAGYDNEAQAIAISIYVAGIFNKSFRSIIRYGSFFYKICIFFIGLSFLLYFSRTLVIIFFMVSLFLSDGIYIRKIFSKQNKAIFKVAVALTFFSYLIVFITSLQSSDSPLVRLVEKFENIPNEVTWNAKKNREAELEDINDNWRGYEAYQGLLKFRKGNSFQKIFGFGFGEKVDLAISMKLAGKYYEKVPVLHNAYVTLLVKSGILGIICYFLFFYQLGFRRVRDSFNDDTEIYSMYQLISGLCIASLVNTFAMYGLLGETATIPLLFGFLWGSIKRRQQHLSNITTHSITQKSLNA